MADTDMSSNRQQCIIYHSHFFTSRDNKEMSSSKNGAVRRTLCQSSLISFNILRWPGGFVNRGEVSEVVSLIHTKESWAWTGHWERDAQRGPHSPANREARTEWGSWELCRGSHPAQGGEGMFVKLGLRSTFSTWKGLRRTFSMWKIHLDKLERWDVISQGQVERAMLTQA